MVPLNTALQSGQTVEIISIRRVGPSLDWLNPEPGLSQKPTRPCQSARWFNALAQQATIARGRDAVEKLLQREGKTATKLDDLAENLGFKTADALFEVVGKDEYSLRNIEQLLRPAEPAPDPDQFIAQNCSGRCRCRRQQSGHFGGGHGFIADPTGPLLQSLRRLMPLAGS